MRKLTLLTMLLAFTVINGVAIAPKPANVVTSTIANVDGANAPLSLQSDLLGSYLNGSSSVVSQIQGVGDWELDMLASPTRRVYVDFSDFVSGPGTLTPPVSGWHPVRFITQCTGYGFNLLNLTTAAPATCGLVVAVHNGSIRYSLRFYSSTVTGAGSNDVTVVCTSMSGGKCNGWRMQSPNGTGKLIARVYNVRTERGKTYLDDHGLYRFSFDMSFTKP